MSLAERLLVGVKTDKFDALKTLELVKKPIPPLKWFAGLVIVEQAPLQIQSILYNDQVLAGELIDQLNNWANYAVVNPLNDDHSQRRYERAYESMVTAQRIILSELGYTPAQLYEYSLFLESKLLGTQLDTFLTRPVDINSEGMLDVHKLNLFRGTQKGTQLRICYL
jgi:hypothetical protein